MVDFIDLIYFFDSGACGIDVKKNKKPKNMPSGYSLVGNPPKVDTSMYSTYLYMFEESRN